MNTTTKKTINLIADIGGTNIRIAQAEQSCAAKYKEIETYRCAEFASLADVISLYIEKKQLHDNVINACLAIACPTDNDIISMTNLPWQFSQKALVETLKLNSLTMINDYTAIAMAIPLLNDSQKVKIGGGQTVTNKPISVCGPGTGLGVANLVPISVAGNNQWHCVSGEGGHVDFAPVGEMEIAVLRYLNTIKNRVSYEQLLSGYGLEQIYQALVNIDDDDEEARLSAQEISKRGVEGTCIMCRQSMLIFCQVLGSFAGNLALIMNSQGGVYIAGGIVPRFIDFLKESKFRERFESKGRLSHITQQTPTYVITEAQPGLLGAAAYILQQ
ncbi:glucokinase [Colwellia sp. KU-HH00111]|uniref:glucokinase n=1 Tax=Colwellia sp. KU-HH00111 TaxID=3127652 RepID=UPI0031020BE7